MRKIILILGALLTSCIMLSTVTALPQTNSKPVMDYIQEIEERSNSITEGFLDASIPDQNGIIDLIKQLVLLIIQFVLNLIDIIRDLIGLVSLIEYLINLITVLFNAVMNLIEAILNLFNPSITVS
ncbi:hypothetical protein B6U98_04905 [Thermoplasmatales archaeon ex4572_165]|nr:MAG: hypothetical protein B6U98_04905 [Thermoplasmatales archaeon ex4572_165]